MQVETSIATSWPINGNGKIVFLEDVGEAAYSIERSLEHMKQAGVFDGAKAVVFGDFTNPDSEVLLNLAIQRFADDDLVECPVFRIAGIGHASTNFPLPLHTRAEIRNVNPEQQRYQLCVNNVPQTSSE